MFEWDYLFCCLFCIVIINGWLMFVVGIVVWILFRGILSVIMVMIFWFLFFIICWIDELIEFFFMIFFELVRNDKSK